VIITIGTSIGLPNNGAIIKTIESSDAEIFSYELYDNTSTLIYSEEPNLWKHITDDELNILPYTSITEGGNTYKSGLISKIISAVRTTLYPVTHAKAVWFNQAASKTMNDFVEDNIDPIEETSTASQSYTVGEHLIYGGIRYIVSSAITAGDTLTPGTNINAKPIGTEIEQINTDLSWKFVDSKTGTDVITLPEKFNELHVHIKLNNDDGENHTYHILKEDLSSSATRIFRHSWYAGAYWDESQIAFTNMDSVKINRTQTNGTVNTSRSIISVYYR
jgi:hypothetical protein